MTAFAGLEHIVREQVPLGPLTWIRLGGVAEYFAEPTSIEELRQLVCHCTEQGTPIRVLGGGSRVLIPDAGVPGVVLHLSAPAFCQISVKGHEIHAGGGAKLSHLVSTAAREGLAGLENLVGIPGTVAGALRGNADSSGSSIGQWTTAAKIAIPIIVHQIGRYEPVLSNHQPPSQTPRNAPTWWMRKTMPKSVAM